MKHSPSMGLLSTTTKKVFLPSRGEQIAVQGTQVIPARRQGQKQPMRRLCRHTLTNEYGIFMVKNDMTMRLGIFYSRQEVGTFGFFGKRPCKALPFAVAFTSDSISH
jgi:hypothetical protein